MPEHTGPVLRYRAELFIDYLDDLMIFFLGRRELSPELSLEIDELRVKVTDLTLKIPLD